VSFPVSQVQKGGSDERTLEGSRKYAKKVGVGLRDDGVRAHAVNREARSK
jgi:hypothetical protein